MARDQVEEWTPNQVVAHNLRRARLLRGWTQTEAVRHLAPYLGPPRQRPTGSKRSEWTQANYSAAERSVEGTPGRVRRFSADELIAFSLAFRLPVTYFLEPPVGVTIRTSERADTRLGRDELIVKVFPHLDETGRRLAEAAEEFARKLDEIREEAPPAAAAIVAHAEWADWGKAAEPTEQTSPTEDREEALRRVVDKLTHVEAVLRKALDAKAWLTEQGPGELESPRRGEEARR